MSKASYGGSGVVGAVVVRVVVVGVVMIQVFVHDSVRFNLSIFILGHQTYDRVYV